MQAQFDWTCSWMVVLSTPSGTGLSRIQHLLLNLLNFLKWLIHLPFFKLSIIILSILISEIDVEQSAVKSQVRLHACSGWPGSILSAKAILWAKAINFQFQHNKHYKKGESSGLVVKVSAAQPRDPGFKSCTQGHCHVILHMILILFNPGRRHNLVI